MILVNIRLLSELPLALALSRRLHARGETLAFCAETDDPVTTARIDTAVADFNARSINMAAKVRAVEAKGNAPSWAGRMSSSARAWLPDRRSADDRALDESPRGKAFLIALSYELVAAREVIAQIKPDLLVVFQDGVSANYALIKAARESGVPIVDCPYGSGTSRDFDDYLDEKAAEDNLHVTDGPFGERVQREYPHWVRHDKRGAVLMFPGEYILVRERLGLSLPLPWVIHGGAADLLAAESEVMYERYLEEGIAATKVKLTGTVYCDVMADRLSSSPEAMAAFAGARKIRSGSTSVLVSLPPSLHGIRSRFSEFETYEAGCEAIVQMFRSRPNVSAVVSLHPNASAEQRRFVENLDLPVSTDWVVPLIPTFDVFFTTFSSTIRWAIASGKPVLNYNMYSYNNHDYDTVEGVFTHRHLREVEATLDRLLDDREYAVVSTRQKADGARWGMMDGQNFERIYGAVSALRPSRPGEARR